MAKSSSTNPSSTKSTKSSGLKNFILIVPLVALLLLILLILINLEIIPSYGLDFDTWKNFSLVILLILIVVLVCILPTGEKSKTVEAVEVSKSETVKKVKKSVKQKPTTMVTVESVEKPVEFVPMGKGKVPSAETEKEVIVAEPISDISTTTAEATAEKKDVKLADIIAPAAKKDKVKPRVIKYPPEVEGGIYGDTFINVNDETVLKLRTLVAEDIYLL